MSSKQRVLKLESKNPYELITFFSLPIGLKNRSEVESKLWEDFIRTGGNKKSQPAFLVALAKTLGFVCYAKVSILRELVMNKSKNPAELGSHLL
jgi:ribosomal protein S19E (S16A)